MKKFMAVAIFLISILIAASSQAYPTIGVDIANSAVESVLTSAPLPDLDGNDRLVTPQFGNISTSFYNNPNVPEGSLGQGSYSGSLSGNRAGLGYTFPSHGDFGFFVYASGAQQSGSFDVSYADGSAVHYTDFKVSGATAFGALQYRLFGDEKSTFAMGLFAGPGYFAFQSNVTYNQVGSTVSPSQISFNPSGTGMISGMQLLFRTDGFRINPYVLAFNGLSAQCQNISIVGGQLVPSSFTCGGNTNSAEVPNSFGGFGLNVGYKSLRFNVYSYLPDLSLRPYTLTSYTLSYGIGI